jgi:membrane protease YdiL (CAAX protease family)
LYIAPVLDPAPEPLSPIPLPDASGSADAPPPQALILPVQRVGALLEVILCSGFPTQVLLIAVLTTLGMQVHTRAGQLSPQFVFTLSLLDTFLLVGLIFFFLRAHRESPRDVLLGPRPVRREALLGLMLIPLALVFVVVVVALILLFAPQLHNVERTPFDSLLQTRLDAFIFAIVAMISGGVREEIQRGFILRRFEQYLGGGWVGIVVFSAAFGLGHVEQGYDAAIATGLLGAGWGAVYLVRRSIVAPMVSHAGFNLAQLVKYLMLAGRV